MTDPRYTIVVDAASSAARRSLRSGFGITVEKSDDLTLQEEEQMLARAARLDCPTGVNNRFVYYCTMRDIDESMFSLLTDADEQVFLRYVVFCFVMFVDSLCLIVVLFCCIAKFPYLFLYLIFAKFPYLFFSIAKFP